MTDQTLDNRSISLTGGTMQRRVAVVVLSIYITTCIRTRSYSSRMLYRKYFNGRAEALSDKIAPRLYRHKWSTNCERKSNYNVLWQSFSLLTTSSRSTRRVADTSELVNRHCCKDVMYTYRTYGKQKWHLIPFVDIPNWIIYNSIVVISKWD